MIDVFRLCSLFIIGLLILAPARAQVATSTTSAAPSTERALALGLPAHLSGTLDASSERIALDDGVHRLADLYTFSIAPGQAFTARMESAAFASQMDVFRDGRDISFDLDFDSEDDAELVTLSEPGEYLLIASTYDENPSGAYELTISASSSDQESLSSPQEHRPEPAVSDNAETAPPSPGAQTEGQVLDGTLSDDDDEITLPPIGAPRKVDAYSTPELRAGDVLVITMESTAFDTYLGVLRGTELVAYNDDDGSTERSRVQYTIPEDGTYTLLASTYTEDGRGAYSLSVGIEAGEPETVADAEPTPPPGTPLSIPARVSGELTDDSESINYTAANRYTLTLSAGQSVTVRMESTAFNTFLRVYREGEPFRENDDYDGSRDISLVFLDSPGDYTIFATAYSTRDRGAYELTVSDATVHPTGLPLAVPAPNDLDPDGPRRARFPFEITEATTSYPVGLSGAAVRATVYTLTLAPGDRVTVRVTLDAGGALPPSPTVYYFLASSPSTRAFRLARSGERFVEFVLDTPDTYTIYVSDKYNLAPIQGVLLLEASDSDFAPDD